MPRPAEPANRLTGGDGADTFVFADNWGNDTITDFVRGEDQLDFTDAGLTFANFTKELSHGGDMVISYGGDSVTLLGVAAIDDSDFI